MTNRRALHEQPLKLLLLTQSGGEGGVPVQKTDVSILLIWGKTDLTDKSTPQKTTNTLTMKQKRKKTIVMRNNLL